MRKIEPENSRHAACGKHKYPAMRGTAANEQPTLLHAESHCIIRRCGHPPSAQSPACSQASASVLLSCLTHRGVIRREPARSPVEVRRGQAFGQKLVCRDTCPPPLGHVPGAGSRHSVRPATVEVLQLCLVGAHGTSHLPI